MNKRQYKKLITSYFLCFGDSQKKKHLCSVAFSGVEGIIRRIESGRKLKGENIKLKPAPNSIYTKIKECKL